MIKFKKNSLILTLIIVLITSFMMAGFFFTPAKTSAISDHNVTKVHFRTTGVYCWVLLFLKDQTDFLGDVKYNSDNGQMLENSTILDNVTVYFTDGAYILRDIFSGDYGTRVMVEDDAIGFKLKEEYKAVKSLGVKINAGTKFVLRDGSSFNTAESRTFFNYGRSDINVVNNYFSGYETIPVSLTRIHLRGEMLIGLGDGNDWGGKGEALPTQAKALDGSTTYSNSESWWKILLGNFTSKVKLHLKEDDTWHTLGSILKFSTNSPQLTFKYNGWSDDNLMRFVIDTKFNGTTVDKVLFEEGCELPSYYFNGNANTPHIVHVLDKEYCLKSNDMTQENWAVNFSEISKYLVSFNGANSIYVYEGDTVPYPTELSQTKPDEGEISYIYNWFLDGELYDFTLPVTQNMNLTSDGTFSSLGAKHLINYYDEKGTLIESVSLNSNQKILLKEVPSKLGYVGEWEFLGDGSAPKIMPEYDISYKAKYTFDFYLTQIQFRSSGNDADEQWFFLRFNDSDYKVVNEVQNPSLIANSNVLETVHVYFTDGAYLLGEIWDGVNIATYKFSDSNTIAFRMKNGFRSIKGIGARIDKGTIIPMLNGESFVIDDTYTFWDNSFSNDKAVGNYTKGYTEIPTTISYIHLRGELVIGLGEGNDWSHEIEALPTQATDISGDTSYAQNYWYKIYLANFTSKIKFHLKETDTWATLGSILDLHGKDPQWIMVYNGWMLEGGSVRISINYSYNGTTVDKIFIEEGCELPSYYFNGNNCEYRVHVIKSNYLLTAKDMTQENFAINWDYKVYHNVTLNDSTVIEVVDGEKLPFPTEYSSSKENTKEFTYIYNWYLDGVLYDFDTPVTKNISLTSDGTFTEIPNVYKIIYYNQDKSMVIETQEYPYGSAITILQPDEIVGYTDVTWATEETIPETMPANDISLVLSGTAKTYTVIFRSEDGDRTITATYNEELGSIPAVPVINGYDCNWVYDGVKVDSSYVWKIDEDNVVIELNKVAKQYNLTFIADGVNVGTIVVTYTEAIGTLPTPPQKDYNNYSWEIDNEEINENTIYSYAEDKTANCKYVLYQYKVTFDGKDEIIVSHGDKLSKPADATKDPSNNIIYVFDGWYLGDKEWDFDNDTVTNNMNLVSKFNEEYRKFTITFVVTGNDAISLNPIEVEYGFTFDLSKILNDYNIDGYTYSITVNGAEKIKIKVTEDTVVNIAFTKIAEDKKGCFGMLGIGSGLSFILLSLGIIVLRKKSN